MSGWADLMRELDAWAKAGRMATFWWRDDDATVVTPALERLLALSNAVRVPVALAVIPKDATHQLAVRLRHEPLVRVLQHGFTHENHAPVGERETEFALTRPREAIIADIAEGWRRLAPFPRALPVMVAPWNRLSENVLPLLAAAGLAAVSTRRARGAAEPVRGVRRTNIHLDIVNWMGNRGFIGAGEALDRVVCHLAERRAGTVDADEPTGLVTHHLFLNEACWAFLGEFLQRTQRHPAVRWLTAEEAFWP